ncbi:hypothetical protein [Pseudonocardia sp. MH-G8]|uniref:hypothetical protein n=1 Tax=Pseudonocardia sp. MH-G8 TaxID=1854588 RepID=UPI0013042F02|nr:hypothetical protein [Pseudonocardia sp. MH-G8]
MAVLESGFIVWGYLLLYVLLTAAYYAWSAYRDRRDRGTGRTTRPAGSAREGSHDG